MSEHEPSASSDFDPRLHTIVRNMIRCLSCNGIVESEHGHDYRSCPCGAVVVDGGRRDLQRTGIQFEELAIVVQKERDA